MNNRSKVTKRQNVLRTSEMHFFSPGSYDSTLTDCCVLLTDPIPLAVSRESTLLHRLSIPGSPPWTGQAPPTAQNEVSESPAVGHVGVYSQFVGVKHIPDSERKTTKIFVFLSLRSIFINP